MLKALHGKRWAMISIGLVFVTLGGLLALALKYYVQLDFFDTKSVFLEGTYSIDDGEWETINPDQPIKTHFHKAVFKGKLLEDMVLFSNINISSKNIWYSLKKADDGTVLFQHTFERREDYLSGLYDLYVSLEHDPDSPMLDKDYFFEHYNEPYFFDFQMPDTPGFANKTHSMAELENMGVTKDTELILELENPYRLARMDLSDSFEVTLSFEDGRYLQFFCEAFPWILLFLLVCFFGLFLFPIAGFILGKINYKYLTFGALCLFWGLYMIGKSISGFLNLWIVEHTVCMMVEIMLNYFFVITVLIYLRSHLERRVTRIIAASLASVYILMVIGALVLHFTHVIDLYASSPNIYIYTALCTVVITVLLAVEAGNNNQAVFILASWTPLTVSIIIDAVNHYLNFADIQFYYYGIAITMIYQIIRLVRDLKKQYKEAIRYQQMQKELYEAKVSIMVSQIQPHFLYNSLSSIAMLCKLDPDTAQKANITFTKYLRGNMDSLKQTTPVPFRRELEHLEKYLYIEKLRFADKLNIEYDIQTTDFELPLLSIQPLVENAVKHGVGMKEEGGTVTIATRETDTDYEVIISDDGVGFDTTVQKNDGRSHVGMENTRRRLKDMCNARVEITSTIGEGTVAKVIIPKGEKKK